MSHNDPRFDSPAQIYVGPPSVALNLREVGACSHFQEDGVPQLRDSLSPEDVARLSNKCALKDLEEDVEQLMNDHELAVGLRKRFMTWVDSGTPGEAETARVKTKRRKGITQEAESTSTSFEQTTGENAVSNSLSALEAGVPACFRYMAHGQLANAYCHRDGRSEENAIAQATPTYNLKHPSNSDNKQSEALKSTGNHLLLLIEVYARPTRNIWAKERLPKNDAGGEGEASSEELDQDARNGEDVEVLSDADADSNGEEGNEEIRSAKKKLRRKGPYGQLQLVQKLRLRSDTTLQDLRDSFICRMDDLPEVCNGEGLSNSTNSRTYTGRKRETDSVLLIEGQLYHEMAASDTSYASLPFDTMGSNGQGSDSRPSKKMLDVRIDSIALHFGKLYWFLHQGSCEHAWCITSARFPRADEAFLDIPGASITDYLQYGYMIRPMVRWSRPANRVESYSLHQCDICLVRTACMIVQGGERFRPPDWAGVQMDGMEAITKTMCETCWLALTGQPPPTIAQLIDRAGRADTADVSRRSWARQSGRGWTIIPSLE